MKKQNRTRGKNWSKTQRKKQKTREGRARIETKKKSRRTT
jgi:hypothetical protein